MKKKTSISEEKRKMQNVKFASIDEFMDFLSDDEKKIVVALRNIVFDQVNGVKEKLSFNVPFYHRHKAICFIWPASVLWGSKKTFEGVQFGFTYGHLLSDYEQILEKGNRKQVYLIYYTDIKQIQPALLRSYLAEAEVIDLEMKNSKR